VLYEILTMFMYLMASCYIAAIKEQHLAGAHEREHGSCHRITLEEGSCPVSILSGVLGKGILSTSVMSVGSHGCS